MAELGSGNGTDYPAALDTDNTLETSATLARSDVPNDSNAAIVAIENELGTNPAGTLANVKTFLQVEHETNGTHDNTKIVMIGGSQTITGEKRFSETVLLTKGSDVASATTLSLGAGNYFDITGTTTVTGITSIGIGTWIKLHFDGVLQLTHHATDFVLWGDANITTVAGDEAEFVEYATGKWRMTGFTRVFNENIASGAVTTSKLENSGTANSQTLTNAEIWTPGAGWYVFISVYNNAGSDFEMTLGGTTRSMPSTQHGMFYTDGSDVVFTSIGVGASVTINYRTLD